MKPDYMQKRPPRQWRLNEIVSQVWKEQSMIVRLRLRTMTRNEALAKYKPKTEQQ